MREGDYGLFVTLSNYTKNAQKYLDNTPIIRGINGTELVDLILKYYAQNGLYKTVTVTVTPGQIVPNTVEDPETEEDALSVEIVEPTDEERTDIELDDTTVEDEIIDAGETQCLPGMFSIECFLPGDIALRRIADNKECVSKMRIKHFETHSNYGRSSAYPHPLLSGPIVPEV